MRFTVDRLDHIVIHCTDVEITATWYQRVLGMDREEFGESQRTALNFGGQKINLRPTAAPIGDWFTSKKIEAGSADICLVTAVRPQDVLEHLEGCKITVEQGPVPKTGALGPMTSVYCRDPDGNLIEISSYMAD